MFPFNAKETPNLNTPKFNLQEAFSNLQSQWSSFLNNPSSDLHRHHQHRHHFPNFPDPSILKTHLQSTFSNFANTAKHAFHPRTSTPSSSSANLKPNPVWAKIPAPNESQLDSFRQPGKTKSGIGIDERLGGVPVYALINSSEELVLVSGVGTGKSLGLFCFKSEDAEALLEQMKSINPTMRSGSRVVALDLNKVFQLKVNGVAFRLIPDSVQVKNALVVRQSAGFRQEDFAGVPVFQEDLENSVLRASRVQKMLNPALRPGDIQVVVLEEIIKGMKDSSNSEWDDIVFIPPGFNVSNGPLQQESSETQSK
ncbi:Tic22-like [Dillenia turbinata]|uniref:Tic22-like n=1 Tax=Dillenia turbinata TaxID=194707 RepID=A0AAN8Z8J0_9MAGN